MLSETLSRSTVNDTDLHLLTKKKSHLKAQMTKAGKYTDIFKYSTKVFSVVT
jgi:hypothetical protein